MKPRTSQERSALPVLALLAGQPPTRRTLLHRLNEGRGRDRVEVAVTRVSGGDGVRAFAQAGRGEGVDVRKPGDGSERLGSIAEGHRAGHLARQYLASPYGSVHVGGEGHFLAHRGR